MLNGFFIAVTHCASSVKHVAPYKHLSRLKLMGHRCGNVVPIKSAPWNLSAVTQEQDDWSMHHTSKERTSDHQITPMCVCTMKTQVHPTHLTPHFV